MNKAPVKKKMCKTCPFRTGSKYAYLAKYLAEQALSKNSRICHSTGSSALYKHTGKPEALCRGARNVQLKYFAGIGFIDEPTERAWKKKCKEMGLI